MANIFSNFGNKIGNAFTNLGQGGTVFNADPAQIASLSDEDKKRFRNQGMQRFLDSLMMASAIESENPQRLATTSNMIRQRKIDQEDAKRKAEQKARMAQYKKNNPGMADILEALESGVPYQLLMMQQNKNQDSNKLRFGNEDKLRDEHQKLSGTFIDVRDAYGRILSNAEEQTAASDLSLIFNYMKMLDPGSVVREGEFANAQNSAGVPDQIRARYNSILSGERLAENTRQDFIQTAQDLYKTQLASQSSLDKNYKDLATSYGLDANKVVLDFSSPIAKKEFKYNLSLMTIADLASLDESQFTEEQKKIIEKEMIKRLQK
tara:strand:- start:453 stop:1415 length:963 start_codon:yes stop_codon:yes gene_type:complete